MHGNGTGRVVDVLHGHSPSFSLYADEDNTQPNGRWSKDALKNTVHAKPSAVSELFFSTMNVDALHDAIRYRVFVESGDRRLVIDRQSDVELGIIMRSVYLQEAKDDDSGDIVAQVRALNASILEFCVPRILQEADMYMHYRRDVSTLPVPLDRGELATMKGDRTLEFKRFF